jgi:transposase
MPVRFGGRGKAFFVPTPIANATSWSTHSVYWLLARGEPADTSDRRAGALLLGGLSALFPRIRTIIADAGRESRKLARTLKQRQGWQLRIIKRRQRAFKITGLTWIVERSFAWLGRNRRLSKDYEYRGANLRDDDRPCRNPPYAVASGDSACAARRAITLRCRG